MAVARHPHGAVQGLGCDRGHQAGRLGGGDELGFQPDAAGAADAALQLHHVVFARRKPQASDRLEDTQLLVQLDAVAAEPHHRRRGIELRHEAGGVAGRAARQLVLLKQHDLAPSRLREVIGDARAGDAAADHHSTGPFHGV